MTNNAEHLVISAIGSDRPGIVDTLSKEAAQQGGNIIDSRMTVLGGEFALIMLVSGSDRAISTLESSLPTLSEELALTTILKRTHARNQLPEARPYDVRVDALDHPGIVHDISRFFSTQSINIEDLQTGTYSAAHTGSPMFSLQMTVAVPSSQSIAQLRERFMEFCDELNLDASLEAHRD